MPLGWEEEETLSFFFKHLYFFVYLLIACFSPTPDWEFHEVRDCVSRVMHPLKDVQVLIPKTCEYVYLMQQ